jgi:flavin reductase (DIM6/NTAB) family NADH-FMN oxidoreductase RutF
MRAKELKVDPNSITALFDQLDREVWLMTACAGPKRGGLIATFVSQASIVPHLPRVLVGVAQQHYTWELIEQSGAFALHLLDEEYLPWVWRFGLQSGRELDKLEGLMPTKGTTGSPLLTEALGWLDCRVEARLDVGDRTIYLAEVVQGQLQRSASPLTLKRLLQLAPADKLRELKELMTRDIAVDEAAIRAWRQRL